MKEHLKRVRCVWFAVIVISTSGAWVSARQSIVFEEIYTIGASQESEVEIFGMYQSVALAKSGRLYIGENDTGEIKVFGEAGEHIVTVGRKGRGPGEFSSLSSLSLSVDEDTLYVHDSINSRVTVYHTPGMHMVRSFQPEGLKPAAPHQMYVLNRDNLVFIGDGPNSKLLAHIVRLNGSHYKSFGELLIIDDPSYDDEFVQSQINQGYASITHDNDIVMSIIAPYVVSRYSSEGKNKWTIRDTMLPKPWHEHIVYTKDRYSVVVYPQIVGVYMIGYDFVMVESYDVEAEISVLDIRDAATGLLLSRTEHSYRGLLRDVVSQGPTYGIAVLRSENPFPAFSVVRWKIDS